MDDWVEIGNDALSAAINPFGAELSSLRDADGRELMTDADPAFWTGRAPILFPIVGKVCGDTIRVDGRSYPIEKHGFARRVTFDVVSHDATRAMFALSDSAETRGHYPFAFRLEIAFAIEGAALSVEATITNPADVPLPASFGFHPAFAWPLPNGAPRADHRITFATDEREVLRVLGDDGTVSMETRASPLQEGVLALDDRLFEHDALIWDRIRSDRVVYGASDGPKLEVAFPDTPMLGIWTKPVLSDAAGGVEGPGAHFICIEPWHGIADPEGYAGEFRDKPGVFVVAPGDAKRIAMRVTLVP